MVPALGILSAFCASLGCVPRRRASPMVLLCAVVVVAFVSLGWWRSSGAPSLELVSARARAHVSVVQLKTPTGGVRSVWIYRPAVPDSASLPVLYFLHGVPGNPSDAFRAGLAESLERYFAAGHAPFVLAVPDGNGTSHTDTEWANAADGSDQVETFVTKTVVRAVEGNHPRDAAHRAIAGFSMGGYGAMNLALRHRDLFGQVVSIAGYFHADDPSGMFGGGQALAAANSPDRHVRSARGLRILLLDADHDTQPVVRGESQRFYRLLRRAGIRATLAITPGRHNWAYASSQFERMESFVDTGWSS
jgi:S-formylglutathione hydrolase FrmB